MAIASGPAYGIPRNETFREPRYLSGGVKLGGAACYLRRFAAFFFGLRFVAGAVSTARSTSPNVALLPGTFTCAASFALFMARSYACIRGY